MLKSLWNMLTDARAFVLNRDNVRASGSKTKARASVSIFHNDFSIRSSLYDVHLAPHTRSETLLRVLKNLRHTLAQLGRALREHQAALKQAVIDSFTVFSNPGMSLEGLCTEGIRDGSLGGSFHILPPCPRGGGNLFL